MHFGTRHNDVIAERGDGYRAAHPPTPPPIIAMSACSSHMIAHSRPTAFFDEISHAHVSDSASVVELAPKLRALGITRERRVRANSDLESVCKF